MLFYNPSDKHKSWVIVPSKCLFKSPFFAETSSPSCFYRSTLECMRKELSCSPNSDANNICGIIYYTHIDKPAPPLPLPLPTTAAYNLTDTCEVEPASTLSPIISTQLSLTATDFFYNEALSATASLNRYSIYLWCLNGTSIQGNWAQSTLRNSSTAATPTKMPSYQSPKRIPGSLSP